MKEIQTASSQGSKPSKRKGFPYESDKESERHFRESIDSLLKINEERRLSKDFKQTPGGTNFISILEHGFNSLFGGYGGQLSTPGAEPIIEETEGASDSFVEDENEFQTDPERKTLHDDRMKQQYSQHKIPSKGGRGLKSVTSMD